MHVKQTSVIVVGHTCLDVIPSLESSPAGDRDLLSEVLAPGQMRKVGPMTLATGGAVPNTGLALHRLGTPARLVGKVGDDMIGRAVLELIENHGRTLTEAMIVDEGASSSYTVILSSPGLDRTFLHYPGPNDTFCSADVPPEALTGGRILHFGYPTLMRRFYLDGGEALIELLDRARDRGLVTSLDVSQPDPKSEAGQVDWRALLANVLPKVDVFLPGLEETLFMLRPETPEGRSPSDVDGALLSALASELLDLGAAVAGLKLGDQGIYLRTASDRERVTPLAKALSLDLRAWLDRDLLAPAFAANLVGTTGAGDCAIAGFLTGLVRGLDPEDVLTGAVAAGAFNVEAADAISGVPSWESMWQRVDAGWEQIPTRFRLRGWGWDVERKLWIGPWDRGGLIA
ncbi:MAG: carbohydrate kinase family protein [Anaerolineae bacterium]